MPKSNPTLRDFCKSWTPIMKLFTRNDKFIKNNKILCRFIPFTYFALLHCIEIIIICYHELITNISISFSKVKNEKKQLINCSSIESYRINLGFKPHFWLDWSNFIIMALNSVLSISPSPFESNYFMSFWYTDWSMFYPEINENFTQFFSDLSYIESSTAIWVDVVKCNIKIMLTHSQL